MCPAPSAWRETYLDRMERTFERDKNHPSIVMWSLGNESGTGANLAAMSEWLHARDPERPVHYEGDRAGEYTDVYSRMYPAIAEVVSIGSDSTALLQDASGVQSARQRTKPFLMCEYVHAMGNGLGGIDRYVDLTEQYPRLHGGFVWEWRDHGIRSKTADGVEFFAYGDDFAAAGIHDGHTCMDGMVLSDGTPSPGLVEFAAVTAPIRFEIDVARGAVAVRIRNLRHSADTADLVFPWRVERDGDEVAAGTVVFVGEDGGAVVAGAEGTALVDLAGVSRSDEGELWFTVSAALEQDAAWASAGHVIAARQARLPEARLPARTPSRTAVRVTDAPLDVAGRYRLGPAEFADGHLVSLGSLAVDGPRLELWRAPTDNDKGSHMGSYDVSDPMEGRGLGVPGPSHASRWREAGLDRLTSRVVAIRRSETMLERRTRWAAADTRAAVTLDERWELDGDDVRVALTFIPSSRWDLVWPRLGVRFDLPVDVDRAEWFGTGPGESYPDSRRGVLVGRRTADVENLTFPYGYPQESGHRSDLRRLDLVAGGRTVLRALAEPDPRGRRPGFTLARHTAQEVDRAAHSHELPTPTRTHLYLDVAQNGLGSRACGPDVWPDALLRPETRSMSLRFGAEMPS